MCAIGTLLKKEGSYPRRADRVAWKYQIRHDTWIPCLSHDMFYLYLHKFQFLLNFCMWLFKQLLFKKREQDFCDSLQFGVWWWFVMYKNVYNTYMYNVMNFTIPTFNSFLLIWNWWKQFFRTWCYVYILINSGNPSHVLLYSDDSLIRVPIVRKSR